MIQDPWILLLQETQSKKNWITSMKIHFISFIYWSQTLNWKDLKIEITQKSFKNMRSQFLHYRKNNLQGSSFCLNNHTLGCHQNIINHFRGYTMGNIKKGYWIIYKLSLVFWTAKLCVLDQLTYFQLLETFSFLRHRAS